jgi:hypothetical protein
VIDNGSGKNRKSIWLVGLELAESRCYALIGLHAFTGNDYVSSIFKKGKDQCWKVLDNFPKFESYFQQLGTSMELSQETFCQLEEYVCFLYGVRIKSVNEARWRIFKKKQDKEHKVTDLASLPPCKQVLQYHAKRANVVAYLWTNSIHAIITHPEIHKNGWLPSGEIYWMDDAFPDEVETILFEADDENEEYAIGSDVESNDEDER